MTFDESIKGYVAVDVAIESNGATIASAKDISSGTALTFFSLGYATCKVTFRQTVSGEFKLLVGSNFSSSDIHNLPYTISTTFGSMQDGYYYAYPISTKLYKRVGDVDINLMGFSFKNTTVRLNVPSTTELMYCYSGETYYRNTIDKTFDSSDYNLTYKTYQKVGSTWPRPACTFTRSSWPNEAFYNFAMSRYLNSPGNYQENKVGTPTIASNNKSYTAQLIWYPESVASGDTEKLNIWETHYGITFRKPAFKLYLGGTIYEPGNHNLFFNAGREYVFYIRGSDIPSRWYQWYQLSIATASQGTVITNNINASKQYTSCKNDTNVDFFKVKVPAQDGGYVIYDTSSNLKSLVANVSIVDGGDYDWPNNTITAKNIPVSISFNWHVGRVKSSGDTSEKENTWTSMTLRPTYEENTQNLKDTVSKFTVKDGFGWWGDVYVLCYISSIVCNDGTRYTTAKHRIKGGVEKDIAV